MRIVGDQLFVMPELDGDNGLEEVYKLGGMCSAVEKKIHALQGGITACLSMHALRVAKVTHARRV